MYSYNCKCLISIPTKQQKLPINKQCQYEPYFGELFFIKLNM